MKKQPKSIPLSEPGKQVKQVKMPFLERIVHEAASVVLEKQAVSLPLQSRMSMRMAWTTEKKDITDRWSWGQHRFWGRPLWKKTLLPFLLEYEKKRWSDIERENAGDDHRYKTYDVTQICEEAQARLIEIGLGDMIVISRFRLGNKPRFYGFLCQHVFFVLWWDVDHKVYPSNIQNRGKIRLRK